MRDTIVTKALKCIDEIYPDEDTLNEGYLPTDAFIDEAVRWVIDNAPTHLLTKRKGVYETECDYDGAVLTVRIIPEREIGESVGVRVVYVMCDDWERPVVDVITEQHPRYLQQQNKVLRGNRARPVVVRVGSSSDSSEEQIQLKLYTTNDEVAEIMVVPYMVDYIPINLADITAWKLAEIVLMSMSDVQAASVCTARVNEHLQQLSL